MKKSLFALAVAGVFSSSAIAATSNVDIYGVMNISIEDTNATNVDMQVTDRQSRIGFKGSEDLGGGLKAIWQIEQAISASPGGQDGVGGAAIGNRPTFVGLSGGFGTVLMGRNDTPYKMTTAGRLDLFFDTMGDVNAAGNLAAASAGRSGATMLISTTHDARPANAVSYVSPKFSGVTFSGTIAAGNADAGMNTVDLVSLALGYEVGPLYLTGAYQTIAATVAGQDDNDAMKFGVGYKFGDAKVGFVYEDVDAHGSVNDRDSWYVNGAYDIGATTLKAQYGRLDAATDASKLTLGADYKLSKRTTAFALYDSNKADGLSRLSGFALGMKHSF